MKNLRKKMKKQGGFTLIEMLIVVAIIAILVAVSIPLVNSSLEKARIATDAANERAAKAIATVKYLTLEEGMETDKVYYYNAVTGDLQEGEPDTKYGKCTTNKHKNGVIKVVIKTDGKVDISWTGGTGIHGINTTTP